jgi:hypothetical protein
MTEELHSQPLTPEVHFSGVVPQREIAISHLIRDA